MKVTENPTETISAVDEDDPVESFLKELEEEKCMIEVWINGQKE